MSKIDELISSQEEVTFRGEKFMIESGFTIEQTPMISRAFGNGDAETKSNGLKEILKHLLKRLYPDATDKEISNVDAKYSVDLLDVFFQLDKTEEEDMDKVKKILEKK